MIRVSQYIGICVLGSFIVWKGVIPAFTIMDTDFPNYYTSSRLLIDGKDISRLYDDTWFQEQITGYGIEQQGKFSPFSPVTAFVMIPLAVLPPQAALQLWTVINIGICVATVAIVSKITGKDWRWSSLLMLGTGIALINNFRFGQWYIVLVFLMLAGYYFFERQQLIIAGILFGVGAAFKYFPIVVLPLFLLRKQWRGAFSFVLTILFIYGVGFIILGSHVYREFFSTIVKEHVSGNIQNPFSATFQSWNSLLRRLFVYDLELNPLPVASSMLLFQVVRYIIIAIVVGVTVWSLRLLDRTRENDKLAIQMAFLTIAGMLLFPASATYHFLILMLPLALLLRSVYSWNNWQRIVVGCYLAIGFLPYRFFRDFDGKQWLTLLAYPRLWMLTIMFAGAFFYVVTHSESNVNSEISLA